MKNRELLRMLLAAAIRHGLTALSVWLVAQRQLTTMPSDDVINTITNYGVDVIPAVVAVIWSMVQKSDTHDEITQGAAVNTLVAPAPPPAVIVVNPAPASEPTKE